MTWITPRSSRILVGTALALAACGATAALATEPASRDAATGQPSGKRIHKPYAAATGNNVACPATEAQRVKVASDPEEGGQIARTAKPTPKPPVSDMTVMKTSDKASPKLSQAAPSGTPTCQ